MGGQTFQGVTDMWEVLKSAPVHGTGENDLKVQRFGVLVALKNL
jgi:hypothetical protein